MKGNKAICGICNNELIDYEFPQDFYNHLKTMHSVYEIKEKFPIAFEIMKKRGFFEELNYRRIILE